MASTINTTTMTTPGRIDQTTRPYRGQVRMSKKTLFWAIAAAIIVVAAVVIAVLQNRAIPTANEYGVMPSAPVYDTTTPGNVPGTAPRAVNPSSSGVGTGVNQINDAAPADGTTPGASQDPKEMPR